MLITSRIVPFGERSHYNSEPNLIYNMPSLGNHGANRGRVICHSRRSKPGTGRKDN